MKVSNTEILKALKQLPLLPNIVKEIHYIKRNHGEQSDYFYQLIEQSSTSSAKILKTVNNEPFRVDNYIESVSKGVQFLGMEMAYALTIYENIKDAFYVDLEAYGANILEYELLMLYKLKTLLKYLNRAQEPQRYTLMLCIMLHNIGLCLITKALKKQNQLDEFYSALMQSHDKNEVEQRFVQITASQLSAIVLKQWKFDDDVVKIVFNLQQNDEQRPLLLALNSIIELYNLQTPLSDASKAKAYANLKAFPKEQEKLKQITQELEESFKSEFKKCRI
jgi:HD-like signal output (HDOD) protein